MGIYHEIKQHFTLNKKEMSRFLELASRGKPEFQGWNVTMRMSGWTTVHVPNWNRPNKEFHQAVNHRHTREYKEF
jgi:hypothetical protein